MVFGRPEVVFCVEPIVLVLSSNNAIGFLKWVGRFLHSLRSVEMTVNDSCLSVEMTVSQTTEAEGGPLSGSLDYIVPVGF